MEIIGTLANNNCALCVLIAFGALHDARQHQIHVYFMTSNEKKSTFFFFFFFSSNYIFRVITYEIYGKSFGHKKKVK